MQSKLKWPHNFQNITLGIFHKYVLLLFLSEKDPKIFPACVLDQYNCGCSSKLVCKLMSGFIFGFLLRSLKVWSQFKEITWYINIVFWGCFYFIHYHQYNFRTLRSHGVHAPYDVTCLRSNIPNAKLKTAHHSIGGFLMIWFIEMDGFTWIWYF